MRLCNGEVGTLGTEVHPSLSLHTHVRVYNV